ncbi:MAG: sulfotransferase [Candidatus Parabeggiatoa sp.]|nr:sulfotransferase [Candidatus Parabeggiatoa sp.]
MTNNPHTTLIFGSGRSGTTWLAELLNCESTYRLLFEPFNARKVESVRHFVFHSQYLRPTSQEPRYTTPIRAILAGEVDHPWVNRRPNTATTVHILIKDIRANMLVRWIKTHYPVLPMIFLMRHPCAVAMSRLELGWEFHLDEYLQQPKLIEDFLEPIAPRLTAITDPFEQHLCTWAIENAVPLMQFQPGEVHVVFYEHLCIKFWNELQRLYEFLGSNRLPSGLADLQHRPSSLAMPHSAITKGENLLTGWQARCTPSQIDRALEILSWFGLDIIYGEQALPLINDGQVALQELDKHKIKIA